MSRSVKKKNIFHSPSQSWDREMQIKFLKGLTQDKTGHLNRGKSCHLRAAERKAPSSLVAQHCHFQVRIFHLNISRLGLSPEYSQKKPSSRSANCCHSECHKNGSHLFWQNWLQFQLTNDWMSGQTILRQSGTTPSHAPEGKQVSLQAPLPPSSQYHHYHRKHHRIILNI